METQRAFLAIVISLAILLGWQYFFTPPQTPAPDQMQPGSEQAEPAKVVLPNVASTQPPPVITSPAEVSATGITTEILPEQAKEIPVETSRFSAVLSEAGGGLKSFRLKDYKESIKTDARLKELITTETPQELPLYFSWGADSARTALPILTSDKKSITASANGEGALIMQGQLMPGVEITRSLTFSDTEYQMQLVVDVYNKTQNSLQGAPFLSLTNRPFSDNTDSQFLFTGPAVLLNGVLQEIAVKDIKKEGGKTISGQLGWVAYEDTYFMCAVVPESGSADQKDSGLSTVRFSVSGEDKVTTLLSAGQDIIPPEGRKQYRYTIYFGPKTIDTLKNVGANLDKIVDFGWWDFIAKPTLYLLKFLYQYLHNYGLAIILVTIIFKLLFWPITQKGMKSMKTMQKIQPKMAKLREKYQDDKERLNQEMLSLYKTYKVNPVGGCLPMLLQIPVFFALYKVLLQTIELRHAPFMLWITDLSAPDRLYIGFDIPMLGGLPVLTLLMGGSMFLQQKMTPTAGDPTQAKIMMFLPVIFTFMFLNFASGLVLYWFVNNLLAIAQQYFVNRQTQEEA